MFYELHDSHGAPQCGCEIIRFADRYELDDYLDFKQDVCERIESGYAVIVERYEPYYLLDSGNYSYTVIPPDEIHDLWVNSIEYGDDGTRTLDEWVKDMTRSGELTYHR